MEAAAGRRAHEMYPLAVGQDQGYLFNRGLLDSRLRPDAWSGDLRIVRELKPNTPSGLATGRRQLAGYRQEVANTPGQNVEEWTFILDLYEP
ncbi:hypothetical protein [Schaalia canis]|uniref:hypothetical protein n=1 Tax=Schaalia canis TaxID=100469 RepID=UPI003B830E82